MSSAYGAQAGVSEHMVEMGLRCKAVAEQFAATWVPASDASFGCSADPYPAPALPGSASCRSPKRVAWVQDAVPGLRHDWQWEGMMTPQAYCEMREQT